MSATPNTQLPRYKCHKEVRALKIATLEVHDDASATITPSDAGRAPFQTRVGWSDRFKGDACEPMDPGYYVVYEDGYTSWSPTKAFEDGYTLQDMA